MADPILKWVGGKRQLLPELLKHIPGDFNDYYEPFVGGGALFFHLQTQAMCPKPVRAHLNDANPHLVNCYLQVRDHIEDLMWQLSGWDKERKEKGLAATYTRCRDLFNKGDQAGKMFPVVLAGAFIALNAWGYNGLCRFNKKGGFNVPCGKFTKTPVLMDKADNLRAASAALKGVEITCGSFDLAVREAKAGDLVYFDPPYIPVSATGDFTSYTSDGFNATDQEILRDLAMNMIRRGVHVILSNSDTPMTRQLYERRPLEGDPRGGTVERYFSLHTVQARRAVNSKASKRGPVGELIIVGRP